MSEVWYKITGHPEYEISNFKQVRGLKFGKILKQYTSKRSGENSVVLHKLGKTPINKLVALRTGSGTPACLKYKVIRDASGIDVLIYNFSFL